MKAEIISIGTELLLGTITDTNSAFIASQLPSLGIDLPFISIVGDNQQRLINTITQAWNRAEIILTTGGLGPTQDDITREAIAEFLNEDRTMDPNLIQELQEYFNKRNAEMPQNNIKQASVIPSVRTIPNIKGTAPGWWVEKEGRIIISMPGPPHEMQYMWTQEILPRLQQKFESSIIVSKTLKTFNLGESKVDELISPFLSGINPTIGIYAKYDGVQVRITAKANNKNEALGMIAKRESDIRAILKDYIWGSDSDTIESVTGNILIAGNLSLSSMESESGGLLSKTISNAPDSSTFYKGGLIAYSNETKVILGIHRELVFNNASDSIEIAEAMATIARNKFETDIGISITGVSDLTGTGDKTTGTIFIGIDDRGKTQSFTRTFPGDRKRVINRSVISALFELRKILLQ